MSWSDPMNFMASALDNIQQDPKANKIMLGIGLAYDVMRNTPPDLYANIPHMITEVDDNVRNDSGAAGGSAP